MNRREFSNRTKRFGLRIFRLVSQLPHAATNCVIAKQLLASGTTVGANYRAACRARSRADFIGKLKIAEEEWDESLYWLELMTEGGILRTEGVASLVKEGEEILSLLVASIKTARRGL
ncbi:MAG TPA: four helix bundle protein [Acidobacteriota bacterium]|nr:four helix bundle protein [Acidobacteriota bacterium]